MNNKGSKRAFSSEEKKLIELLARIIVSKTMADLKKEKPHSQDISNFNKTIYMSDNKKAKGKQDRIRVDSKDSSEVEYLHRKFPSLKHQQVSGAVRAAGPLRKDIEAYLKKKYMLK